MSINYQINNLLHILYVNKSLINLNIMYNKANSFYDLFIKDIPETNFIDELIVKDYKIPYGLTLINDPIKAMEDKQGLLYNYSNKILFFHTDAHSHFKKEDIYLIDQEISKYKKYSFIPNVKNKFSNIELIKYGFDLNSTKMSKDRTNDIIILYSGDNRQAEMLQSFIKSKYMSVTTLNVKDVQSKSMILETLNTYKICIDINSYYNILLAVSCGCYGLSVALPENNNFIYNIDDFNNINNIIENLLNNYNDSYIDSSQEYIKDNYSNETFRLNIQNIINTNYKLPVTL